MNRIDKIMQALGHRRFCSRTDENSSSSNNDSIKVPAMDTVISTEGIDNAFCNKVPAMDTVISTEGNDNAFCNKVPAMDTVISTEGNDNAFCNKEDGANFLADSEMAMMYNNDILYENEESPVAPLYSPLTPLVKKVSTHQTENILFESRPSSPLRPMTPNTLDLWQTLSGVLSSPVELETVERNLEDMETEKEMAASNSNKNDETDFSADTDSDYIPDSEESNSDKENVSHKFIKKVTVVAVMHNEKNQIGQNTLLDSSSQKLIPNVDTINEAIECAEIINDPNLEKIEEHSDRLNIPEALSGRPKRGRKRIHENHTIAQRKARKYANLPYNTKKKLVKPKIFRNYTCQCKKQCFQHISEEKREEEFKKYILLGSYEAQLLFIVNCISEAPKKRSYVTNNKKTNKSNPKQFSRIYTLGGIQVCREMFINNFQITTKKVDESLKKHRKGLIKDRRGQTGGFNKTSDEEVNFIKEVINSLPKYESHYRRGENNGCQYLKLGMTVSKIYELYLEQHKNKYGESKKPVSINTLKNIFYKYFNLRCKSLKKDTCNKCDTLHFKIMNATGAEAAKFQQEKQEHLGRAETLRKKLKEDFMRATTDEKFECLTFDMEKTLPLPRIPTSVVFYKRQLWLYNCGIHAASDDSGHCFVWLEGEAGRGSQEVGSCLINYIKNNMGPKEHLVLWSDCCGGQNRNIKMVLIMKSILNSHPSLKTITLKYLESGHTFLPNDTDFSKIETQLKYHERIYTAEEYINVIKICKKKNPLKVYRMKTENFLGTKNLEKKIVNRKTFVAKNKVNWLKTKEILIKKEDTHSIFMKTSEAEDYQELNLEKKVKGRSLEILEEDLCLLWPNGKDIPQVKLDDLKSMFDLIPKDCLPFYQSLKGNANIIDDVDGYGGVVDFPFEDESQD